MTIKTAPGVDGTGSGRQAQHGAADDIPIINGEKEESQVWKITGRTV